MVLVILAIVFSFSNQVMAQAPPVINFQASINTADCEQRPLTVDARFIIYDAEDVGTSVWEEQIQDALIENCELRVFLGSASGGIPETVFEGNGDRFLELRIDGEILTPRYRLVSQAYALRANIADKASSYDSDTGIRANGIVIGRDGDVDYEFEYETIGTKGNENLRLQSNNSLIMHTGGEPRMVINSTGQVGIGSGNEPNADLDVSARAIKLGIEKNGGGQLYIGNDQGDNKIFLEAFNSTGDGSAEELLLTGYLASAVPKISFLAQLTEASGNFNVAGNLSKGGGAFKIDHPLDPTNKYLSHSFVESPDMMNVYNGNIELDMNGEAWVELPDWFGALNRDFRYQLTCIGGQALVYIAEEIANNRFMIAGGTPGLKVSWQVTGIRHDPYAEHNRIKVEEEKPVNVQGQYLHPEAYQSSNQ